MYDLQPKILLPLPGLLGIHQLSYCRRQVLILNQNILRSDPQPKISCFILVLPYCRRQVLILSQKYFTFAFLSYLQGHIGSKLQQAGANYNILFVWQLSSVFELFISIVWQLSTYLCLNFSWTNCPRLTMKMAAATGGKKRSLWCFAFDDFKLGIFTVQCLSTNKKFFFQICSCSQSQCNGAPEKRKLTLSLVLFFVFIPLLALAWTDPREWKCSRK